MKIFSLIRLFITSKWRFILPKKSKIMIYDQVGSDFLIKFFNEKDCKILHTRFEEINVSILLMSIFKFYKENLKLSKKYVYQYIHYVKPKLIITYIDNNISYYKLKEKFKDITIIAVQNGVRTDFFKFFENVTKKDNLSIDYLFVMDEITKKCYSSFLKGNIIVNGSIKNNSIPIKKNENNSKKILFLSQYRNPKLFKHIDIWGNKISFANHFKTETKLIPLLADYCKKHQIYFEICGASKNHDEAYFYKSLIKEKNNNWNFYPKVDIQTTYEMVDQATAIVFIDTTLGYETLSRGIPVAAFSTRGKNLNFGLPKQFSDRGPFWTNYLDETTLNEILGLVLNISKEDWNKIYNKHARDIASYDEGNKKFKNILKSINIPLVKQN